MQVWAFMVIAAVAWFAFSRLRQPGRVVLLSRTFSSFGVLDGLNSGSSDGTLRGTDTTQDEPVTVAGGGTSHELLRKTGYEPHSVPDLSLRQGRRRCLLRELDARDALYVDLEERSADGALRWSVALRDLWKKDGLQPATLGYPAEASIRHNYDTTDKILSKKMVLP
jgi:hypothetical protein